MRFVVGRISADEQFEAVPYFNDILGHFSVAAFFTTELSRVKLVQDDPAFTVPNVPFITV